jgi:hypothetical protein
MIFPMLTVAIRFDLHYFELLVVAQCKSLCKEQLEQLIPQSSVEANADERHSLESGGKNKLA